MFVNCMPFNHRHPLDYLSRSPSTVVETLVFASEIVCFRVARPSPATFLPGHAILRLYFVVP